MSEPQLQDLLRDIAEQTTPVDLLPRVRRGLQRRRRRQASLAAGAVAAIVAGATIGAVHLTGGGPASPNRSGHPATDTSQTPQERERLAVAYAQRLAGDGPHVAGETSLSSVPAKLRRPGQTIASESLIVRARYWTVAGSPGRLYTALKQAAVTHLKLSGYGGPGAGSNAPNYADLFYTGTDFPPYLQTAELYVEILGVGGGRSDIAAFAEVLPYPIRQASERIPTNADKVVVTRTQLTIPGDAPLRSVTLTAAQAHQLITAFNRAHVSPDSQCIGGLPPSFGYGATITAQGHTWQLYWRGLEGCDALTVQRDGQTMKNLETPPGMITLFTKALDGPNGSVDGQLWKTTGRSTRPVPGTVFLSQNGHVVGRSAVGRRGAFELTVPPGQYTLTARSQQFHRGRVTCRGQQPVEVHPDEYAYGYIRCRT